MVSASDVYFCPGRGYLVVPIAPRADLWATTSLYPAQALPASADPGEVGLAVLNGLRRSENARPQMLSQADRFWVAMGCHSYQDFCRDFVGVTVERRGYRLWVAPLVRDSTYGGYRVGEKGATELFRFASAEELGDVVVGLLGSPRPVAAPEHACRLTTLDGWEVAYAVPSVGLVDQGDAGSDFYRVYTLEENPRDWVGFLIGERYQTVDEQGIRARWDEEYGELAAFSCEEGEGESLLLAASGAELEVRARIWRGAGTWLEVRAELVTADVDGAAAERARRLLGGVLDSCVVERDALSGSRTPPRR